MAESAQLGQTRMNIDEAALLAELQAGDGAAFERCVRSYSGQLWRVARRILRNDEDAADALQDAFLSAFKRIKDFRGESQLGTWLHRIVVNAALGRLRRQQRHPETSIENLLPHFVEGEHQIDPPVPWKGLDETGVQRHETHELVQRCINQLPETYRIVLLLRDIEGLDSQETAQTLDTSVAVVKTRLHRARQALRTLLDPYFRRGAV